MSPRIKKLIGFTLFLPVLMLYLFAAAAVGERVPDHQLLKAAFFLTAGIAWAFPAKYLMVWMNRDPKAANSVPDRD